MKSKNFNYNFSLSVKHGTSYLQSRSICCSRQKQCILISVGLGLTVTMLTLKGINWFWVKKCSSFSSTHDKIQLELLNYYRICTKRKSTTGLIYKSTLPLSSPVL